MHARCIGHVLVDDLDDARSTRHRVDTPAVGHMRGDGFLRGFDIELHATTREGLRIELAEKQVRVRHRRPRAAKSVAGRAGR